MTKYSTDWTESMRALSKNKNSLSGRRSDEHVKKRRMIFFSGFKNHQGFTYPFSPMKVDPELDILQGVKNVGLELFGPWFMTQFNTTPPPPNKNKKIRWCVFRCGREEQSLSIKLRGHRGHRHLLKELTYLPFWSTRLYEDVNWILLFTNSATPLALKLNLELKTWLI